MKAASIFSVMKQWKLFRLQIKCVLVLFLTFFFTGFTKASVVIDSAITTESTCQANGVIEVIAHGTGAPFIYSITAGPVTRPSQSSRFFNALPVGTYTVQVQNQNGEIASINTVDVVGIYQLMSLAPIPVIGCTNASNGNIIGNLLSGGKGPYTWQLVTPSPVTTQPQATDTFYNLPDGSYTVRVTDDCGNFQTTGVVLASVPSSMQFLDYDIRLACNNSAQVDFRFTYINLQFPMTLTVYDDVGDSTSIYINDYYGYLSGGTNWAIYPQYQTIQVSTMLQHSVMGGSTWHAVITNACGVTAIGGGYTASIVYPSATNVLPLTCPPKIAYSAGSTNNNGFYTLLTRDSIHYYLLDLTLNQIVDSGWAQNGPNSQVGIPGHSYRYLLMNSCGTAFTSEDWIWASPAPPAIYTYPVGTECLDSTISISFQIYNFNYTGPITWIIKSGPPTLQSTKPGFEYHHTLTYPDTIVNTFGGLELRNLPVGHYTFSVEDTCGQRIDSFFNILPENLDSKSYSFTTSITGQCGIFNAIDLYINRGLQYGYAFAVPHFTYTITNISTAQVIETDNIVDSVLKTIYNVPTGTYVLRIDFFEFNPPYFEYLNNNDFCTTILDTIVVRGSPFPHITDLINSFCQATVATQLVIDSTGGVAPYTYEIIAGPQTFPPQTSNIFQLPSIGTYTFRVVDACGNSYVSATSIDTLRFPAIEISATPCPGANVQLIPVISPFYSYKWIRPSGGIYIGDTLNIPHVAASDTGTYTVIRFANIGGCRDTVQSTVHLEMLARVSQSVTSCMGDTIRVGQFIHTTSGSYIDTLTAAGGCDSIVTTQINLIPVAYSSQTLVVCQGASIIVGNHTHVLNDTSVNLITDTLQGARGCDSMVTTHVTIKPSFSSTVTVNACQGDTLWLPVDLHFANGVVSIDTVPITINSVILTGLYTQTNGCDSSYYTRVIGNPIYFNVMRDTICQGEARILANHTHTTSGSFLDTLTSAKGCDSVILLLLYVRPADTSFSTQTICSGQAVWGHSSSGIYADTLQNASGCDSIVILTLNVVDYLQDSIARSICNGQSVSVGPHIYSQTGVYRDTLSTVHCDSIVILNLTVSNYIRDSISQTICAGRSFAVGTHTYSQTGYYSDTLSTVNCDSIVFLQLTVNTAGRDTITKNICSGQTFTVGAHTYSQTGIYYDTLATANCDSIVVLYLTTGAYKSDSTTYSICTGDSITLGLNTYSRNGVYRDTIPSSPCDSISIIRIDVLPLPVINANAARDAALAGDTVQLNVVSGATLNYTWTGGILTNANIKDPIATINIAAWFFVSVTDANSCPAIDSVFIDLLPEGCNKNSLYVPNAFTPNADGSNDDFEIYTACPMNKFEILIFNRWGEKVFESQDQYFKWNGYYKGQLQSMGVYVYYIKGAFTNGEPVVLKGSITLIR